MSKLPVHKMDPNNSYALACGTKHGPNPIFEFGHGASIYWQDVDCPDCLEVLGPQCEDEGCPHYGTLHSHTEEK